MKHTQRMLAGGSNIVGGVNPRKAGETVEVEGKSLPVFGTVAEAMSAMRHSTIKIEIVSAENFHASCLK